MVLVDSSVWIDYFNGKTRDPLQMLLDSGQACVNDVILSEVMPILIFRQNKEACDLMASLPQYATKVTWQEALEAQVQNLRAGINGVNLLDILIALNAKKNGLDVLTYDKHFALMSPVFGFALWH